MTMAFRTLAAASAVLATMVVAVPHAGADAVADFYRNRTLQMLIATSPGGDYDLRARLISRHLGRHIPGGPTLVPSNMPGGVGLAAANYVANVAPRDGSVLHAIMQGMAALQATSGEGVKYDVRKLRWIGNSTDGPNVINSWYTTGITSIEQVMKQELVVGAPGVATTSSFYPQALNMLAGTKFKIISGYPGGNDVNLAMEKGEVGGRGSNSWASWKSTKPQWLAEKKIHILVQIGLKRHPELPDVPLMLELAKNDEDREVLRFLSSDTAISRAYVTTEGTPEERVSALRRAFDETMKDPEFLAEANKAQMDISPGTGELCEQVAAGMVNASESVRMRAKAILEGTAK
jgi:tripartite-type tricarboxylate transporter receptor subunit TctC